MAYEFRFPDVGEGVAEGEIVEWKVRVGDRVEAHQTLVVMETDKAVVEIPSPVAGVIERLNGEPGDVIEVGAVLAVIGETSEARAASPARAEAEGPGEAPPVRKEAAGAAESETRPGAGVAEIPIPGGRPRSAGPRVSVPVSRGSVGVVGELEEAPEDEEEAERAAGEEGSPLSRRRARVLPRDRALARSLGLEVDALRGTGPGGRVTESDIRQAVGRGGAGKELSPPRGESQRDAYGPVERIRARGVRRKIAQTMIRSLSSAAQVTTTDEARIGLLWHIREKEKASAAQQGVRLTLLPFVVKAVVAALRRDPYLNAVFEDQTEEVILKGYYNIGVAVETRDGLMVPNIKGCDRVTILEIARSVQELSSRARERTLKVDELKGGTFTISNYGSIGGIFGTPILNPPEVGLLGMGRVAEKPVAVDGAIKIERVLPLSLTFDHRVVDGATAQHFLNNVVRFLEDPDRILLGE